MENKTLAWLNAEIEKRGWTQNELARRAGLSSGTISNVLTSQKGAGLDFCLGIAKALAIPPEHVLRRLGLIDPLPDADDPVLQELIDYARRLPVHLRNDTLQYIKFRYQSEC